MSTDNILVAVKTRPLIQKEKTEGQRVQWKIHDEAIFQIDENGHRISEPYSFDHIFTEHTTNADVYTTIVEPLVKSFLNGFNSTIFAYGQTSTGKTHTMMGNSDTPGIIQLAVNEVFKHINQNTDRRYLVSCSYFEIYNEKIIDLLDKNGHDIKIREDCYGNTFINAKEEVVSEQIQVFELMKVGSKIKKIACTNMNERSSRSHTIFRVTIKSTENNIDHGPVQISHLNLVDLAGSERISQTKAQGVRLKEGVNINKSLLALGNVIRQLSEGEGFINYRDSNLTRLLQHALGGNAKSLIIATITVAAGEETKSTLEFAQKAKVVKNKPVINEISEQDKLKQYKFITTAYKERLEKEQQRILEMEQEKIDREREITKLKQQVKLIDLFTNGPAVKKSESSIPRRHTTGHYCGSRIPLQTIPESRILSTNIMPEKQTEYSSKPDDDEDVFLQSVSQISDYDYMKSVVEETLDDCMLVITPEPPEELFSQDEATPTSHLRTRLKSLEESYVSLQEFTKLEAEFREGKDIVCELVKEKENMLKDLIDLNAMIKETKQEKEIMKTKFEDQLNNLNNEVDCLKKKNDKLAVALKQAERETDTLRLAKEQLLIDSEVALEQLKLKYEKQLQYLSSQIERMNKEEEDKMKIDSDLEKEMKKLRMENESIKSYLDKISDYEVKIVELEEKLQKFEQDDKQNDEILSKLYLLQDILLDVNIEVQGVSVQTDDTVDIENELKDITNETMLVIKECHQLRENIQKLNIEIEHLQFQTIALQEQGKIHKEDSAALLELDIRNENLKRDIASKENELIALLAKVQNMEEENKIQKEEMTKQLENIRMGDQKVADLTNKINVLEQIGQTNKEEIQSLLNQIKIEDNEQNLRLHLREEVEAYKKELKSKTREIIAMADQLRLLQIEVDCLETRLDANTRKLEEESRNNLLLNEEVKKLMLKRNQDIEASKLELELKDGKIRALTLETEKLGRDLHILELKRTEESKDCMGNLLLKNNEILDLKSNIDKLQEQLKEKVCLQEKVKQLELEKQEKTETYKFDMEIKDREISALKSQIEILQKELQEKVIFGEKMEELESKRLEEIESFKSNFVMKDDEIIALNRKIEDLEETLKKKPNLDELKDLELKRLQETQALKSDLLLRDDQIMNLKSKLEAINIQHSENVADIAAYKKEIQKKNQEITNIHNKVGKLEKDNENYKQEINNLRRDMISKEREIIGLTEETIRLERQIQKYKIKFDDAEDLLQKVLQLKEENKVLKEVKLENNRLQEEIDESNKEITQLNERIQELETMNFVSQDELYCKEQKLFDLNYEIDRLEKMVTSNEEKIFELNSNLETLSQENASKDSKIRYLQGQLEDKEKVLLETKNAFDNLQKENISKNEQNVGFKKVIQTLEDTISFKDEVTKELRHKITTLDQSCRSYEDEIMFLKEDIVRQESKVKELLSGKDMREMEINKLKSDKQDLELFLHKTLSNNEAAKKKIHELEDTIKKIHSENNTLKSKMFDLENQITELRSSIMTERSDSRSSHRSLTPSVDLSPKEVRRRKRQSIQDQRRGIDLTAAAAFVDVDKDSETLGVTENEMKDKIKVLNDRIEYLRMENDHLELEVQGFIRELEDCRGYNMEQDKEIEDLKAELQKVKKAESVAVCKHCQERENYIKKLEELQKQNQYKIVDLQTNVYDLQNKLKEERTYLEDKERRMKFQIEELEARLGNTLKNQQDAQIQCDLMNYQQLMNKYVAIKKLARMRREEGNALRARLGMNPDEPLS